MTRAAIARLRLAAVQLTELGAMIGITALAGCGDEGWVAYRYSDAGAGASSREPGNPSVNDGAFGFASAGDASVPSCSDPALLCIGPNECPNGEVTTLTGTVFDPAGKNPVYDAVVLIPRDTVPPIKTGASSCGTCPDVVGDYVAATTTDATGAFKLTEAPAGRNVPLVIQTGKWRRQVILPNVQFCQTMQVPAELTRLPRNQSEGDIPQLAVLTGACDRIACFVRRMGLDPSEFTGPDGGGRVHVYRGAGPGPDLAGGGGGTAGDCTGAAGPCPLWTSRAQLERYDTVLLGCECGENNQTKPDKSQMRDWLDEGGRAIAVHNQETWFKNGASDLQSIATWTDTANGATDASSGGSTDVPPTGPFAINTTFPKGEFYENWLAGAGATSANGRIPLDLADVNGTITAAAPASTAWITANGSASTVTPPLDQPPPPPPGSTPLPGKVEYMSFGTPVGGVDMGTGALNFCGRSVVTDVHVGANGAVSTSPVPASCDDSDLSAEEKALEFLFFDTGVCIDNTQLVKGIPPRQ
jgi:hypothetical protein